MNKNLFELVIVDKRDLPEEKETIYDEGFETSYINNSIWQCKCSLKAKFVYLMISTFLDGHELDTVLDFQNFVIKVSHKSDIKYFTNKDNFTNDLNALINCKMLSIDDKYIYVY